MSNLLKHAPWSTVIFVISKSQLNKKRSSNGSGFHRFCARLYIENLQIMSWLEQKIRRYEHARWTTDDNRRVFPFEWGLEHIGGRRDEPDPRAFLNPWGEENIAT